MQIIGKREDRVKRFNFLNTFSFHDLHLSRQLQEEWKARIHMPKEKKKKDLT